MRYARAQPAAVATANRTPPHRRPAAAISLLVCEAVQVHGLGALPFITLCCGGLQVLSGVTRMGVVTKLVPVRAEEAHGSTTQQRLRHNLGAFLQVCVISGFTAGIGAMIFTGQLPRALGIAAPAGLNTVELLQTVAGQLADVNPAAAGLAAGTCATMLLLPKFMNRIPAALVAVGGSTAATRLLGLNVSTIGALPSGIEVFQMASIAIPPVEALPSLAGTVCLIYAMTSVESLISCSAVDKVRRTSYKHSADQELIGQGLANVTAAAFTGMPVTSVIARSSVNVQMHASTRLPSLVQSGFIFSSVVFLSDTIATIPLPALSGVLITSAIGMLNPAEFVRCYKIQPTDAVPFAVTSVGMLTVGLAEGISMGCVAAVGMNSVVNGMRLSNQLADFRMAKALDIPLWEAAGRGGILADAQHDFASSPLLAQTGLPTTTTTSPMAQDVALFMGTMDKVTGAAKTQSMRVVDTNSQKLSIDVNAHIWKLSGPINFLSMLRIDDFASQLKQYRGSEAIIIDAHAVPTCEFTGGEELINRLAEVVDGRAVHIVNCAPQVGSSLKLCSHSGQIDQISIYSRLSLDNEPVNLNEHRKGATFAAPGG